MRQETIYIDDNERLDSSSQRQDDEEQEVVIDSSLEEEIVFMGDIINVSEKKQDQLQPIDLSTCYIKIKEMPVNVKSKTSYNYLMIRRANNFMYENKSKSLTHIVNSKNIQVNSKYSPIISRKSIEKSSCDVCGDKYSWYDDEIVACDLCNYVCHRSCYGGDIYHNIPEEKWYCQRCEHLIKNDCDFREIKCLLCPDSKGIMKKVGNNWFHIDCVNWTPEIYFEDDLKTKINLSFLNKERFNGLVCDICALNEGSVIKCDYKDCTYSFHVRCAKMKGLIPPIFCKEHLKITRKMKIENVRKCEAECDSKWTSKESLAEYEDINKIDDENNNQMFTQKKSKRGRPRKYNNISRKNSISGNKISKFEVSFNSMPAPPQKPINPSDRIGSHMNRFK
jgi:hypothetical protein